MPKVVPPSPIAYAVASDTLVIHREDGARWHVQCDRFAAQVAGEEEGLFERWAARLREHREEVEAARPRMDSGWLEGFLSRAFPHAKPIVDGIVSEWLFIADDDYIAATARIGREAFEECVAAGIIPASVSYEAALSLGSAPQASAPAPQ